MLNAKVNSHMYKESASEILLIPKEIMGKGGCYFYIFFHFVKMRVE